jgi:riboflavin kinase/FMN adenylyltransferase
MANHVVNWDEAFPRACQGGAVCVGKFDGVHLGHAALVAECVARARALHAPAVVVTFDPHPLRVLRPEQPLTLLTTTQDRAELLHRLGADHVLALRTTAELLDLRAADFFERVLLRSLGARAVVEGPDFRFGRGREGDVPLLRRLCGEADVELAVVPKIVIGGAEVSSGRVRSALLRGDAAAAAQLLGRPYLIRGTVGTGRRVGRTIGFPTANLEGVTTLVPADGVYAAFARPADGGRRPAAVNVGGQPTFGEQPRRIEAHLLDFDGDLYGQGLALEFVERLRETRPFGGVGELTEQLRRDVERARQVLTERPPS